MLGIAFRRDRDAPTDGPAELVRMCRERGLLVLTAGTDAVRLVPSLNVGVGEVDFACDVIESVLGEMVKAGR